jgi:hypothetical protein
MQKRPEKEQLCLQRLAPAVRHVDDDEVDSTSPGKRER